MVGREIRVIGLCLAIVLGIGVWCAIGNARSLSAGGAHDEVSFTISGDVYFGDRNSFKNPCVLERKKVFAEIPAVKAIIREKLEKDCARYAFLIEQANKVFRTAVEEAAQSGGYDLAVERGGIRSSDGNRIPDITKTVIDQIPQS